MRQRIEGALMALFVVGVLCLFWKQHRADQEVVFRIGCSMVAGNSPEFCAREARAYVDR